MVSTEFTCFEGGGPSTAEYDEKIIAASFEVALTQNPFKEAPRLQITTKIESMGPVQISVIDVYGKHIRSFELMLQGSQTFLLCDEISSLPAGTYLVVSIDDENVIVRAIKM